MAYIKRKDNVLSRQKKKERKKNGMAKAEYRICVYLCVYVCAVYIFVFYLFINKQIYYIYIYICIHDDNLSLVCC